jgi:hypothetical protein
MVWAYKRTDMDFPFKNPTGQTTYVFNREFPRGIKYNKDGQEVEGQEVKPTHYIFIDFEGGEYPVSPTTFRSSYTLARPGVARAILRPPREFREFGRTNTTSPPLYYSNDMIPVINGEYPINRAIFDATYKVVPEPLVQDMSPTHENKKVE